MDTFWGSGSLTTTGTLGDGVTITGSRYIYGILVNHTNTAATSAGTFTINNAAGTETLLRLSIGTSGSAVPMYVFKGQFYAPTGLNIVLDTPIAGTPGTDFNVTVFHSH